MVRSVGAAVEREITPLATPRAADRWVALDRMQEVLHRIEWAPLRLSGETRTRPASPRLPQALVLHLAHLGRLASGRDAAVAGVPIPLELGALASFLGTDDAGAAAAVRALQQAGVVHTVGRGAYDGLSATVALGPALLGAAPRCAALDWSGLALATAGSPSAWVAAHVLAERLVLDEWTPMPRSALERTFACGVSGVRSALDRLTTAGVVERREQRGGVSAYRFSPALYAPTVRARGAPAVGDAPVVEPGVGPAQVASSNVAAATGVRLSVGGVELDVPAGLRVRVELGADGTPQITLVPAAPPG